MGAACQCPSPSADPKWSEITAATLTASATQSSDVGRGRVAAPGATRVETADAAAVAAACAPDATSAVAAPGVASAARLALAAPSATSAATTAFAVTGASTDARSLNMPVKAVQVVAATAVRLRLVLAEAMARGEVAFKLLK